MAGLAFTLGKGVIETQWDTKGLQKGLQGISTKLSGLQSKFAPLTRAASRAFIVMTAGLGFATYAAGKQADAEIKLESMVKRTGQAAGFTADQLKKQAAEMQKLTGFSDDLVMGMQVVLGSFTSISGINFERAQKAIADIAYTMDTDLRTAAKQVGMALEDPATGMSRLRLSGVSFTEAEKAMVKQLVEVGRKAEAQAMILDILDRQTADATDRAKGLGGTLRQLKNEAGDLAEEVGFALAPMLLELVKDLRDVIAPVAQWIRDNRELAKTLILVTVGAVGATAAIGKLIGLASGIIGLVGTIGLVPLAFGAVIIAALAAVAAIALMQSKGETMGEKLTDLLGGIEELLNNIKGTIISMALEFVRMNPLFKLFDFISGGALGAELDALQYGALGMDGSINFGKATKIDPQYAGSKSTPGGGGVAAGIGSFELPSMDVAKEAFQSSFIGLRDAFTQLSTTRDPLAEAQLEETKFLVELQKHRAKQEAAYAAAAEAAQSEANDLLEQIANGGTTATLA